MAALRRTVCEFRLLFVSALKRPKTPCRHLSARLSEVGELESPKLQGQYDTGQVFLHRLLGYRGVVLFPWVGQFYDRDIAAKEEASGKSTSSNTSGKDQKIKSREHTYYQVLIDMRDMPHIRVGTESVTFLSNTDNEKSSRNVRMPVYSIPGLDYAGHEDILPYRASEKQPIQNDLFDRFLTPDQQDETGSYLACDTLLEWQAKNHQWLELTNVYRETTENIRITVMPFFIGSKEVQQTRHYWWRYCICLEHLGGETVQLRERHMRIFSLSGYLDKTRAKGIVGKEPLFSKENPAFQYTSHVSLQAPSGHMWGTFKMEKQDGSTFEAHIPPFTLESEHEDHGFVV